MGRSRTRTRHTARSYPRGTLAVYADGYGFVRTSEGDFFIPAKKMNGAFDGDLVEVSPLPQGGKRGKGFAAAETGHVAGKESPAARVVHVMDRAHESIVGRYEVAEPFGVVVPLDYHMQHDVFTLRKDNPTIPDGALVRVRITSFPTGRSAAMGVIEEVLDEGARQVFVVDALIERHNLETSFSEGALAEASALGVNEDDALRNGYRDMRERVVFTIDPEDARDFDDAVSLERATGSPAWGRTGTGGIPIAWRLGVHIADVAHYVPWDSSLDLDARRRATSVYLADRVLPMLPELLSNELCSLKPGVVRRCMTVDLYLDKAAEVVEVDIYPALMESKRRLSYPEVQSLLERRGALASAEGGALGSAEGGALGSAEERASRTVEGEASCVAEGDGHGFAEKGAFASIEERLCALSFLAALRRQRRRKRGAPEFTQVEAKVKLNEQREPLGVELREKNEATELIEEAMIMANEAVAHYLVEQGIPGLFRVHEAPLPMNCAALLPLFEEYPWFAQVNKVLFAQGNSFQIQKVLELSRNRTEAELVSLLTLRAMKQAVYSPSCEGHFGLASDEYLHFTSPIRRYPDLIVHRMLKAHLEKQRLGVLPAPLKKALVQEVSQLSWLAQHCSKMERLAERVARESHEYLIVEYMQQFVGQRFSATVSGVTSYGVYVRLDNTAEGLLPLSELGAEYFIFDGVHHTLTGEESATTYRLAQRVVVVLSAADPLTRNLSFKLYRNTPEKGKCVPARG